MYHERPKENGRLIDTIALPLQNEDIAFEISELEKKVADLWSAWRNEVITPEEREQKYRQHLFPHVARLFYLREKTECQYDLLISTVGTSLEPIVLTLLTLKPTHTVFICTPESKALLEDIQTYTGLSLVRYDIVVVEKEDMTGVYEKVRYYVRPGHRVAVDITGGTKVMSAGATLGAVLSNPDIFYVSSQLDWQVRKPVAGTERLLRVQNPLSVNQDLEIRAALRLWEKGNYAAAGSVLLDMENAVEDPRRLRIWGHLAAAYGAWELFRFNEALSAMEVVLRCVTNYQRCEGAYGLWAYREKLERQLTLLRELAVMDRQSKGGTLDILQNLPLVSALVFSLWGTVCRLENQERLDVAALLLYRMTEILSQRRLALHGFDTSNPDYQKLGEPTDILENMQKLLRQSNLVVPHELPRNVALSHGYALLQIINDPWPVERLQKFSGQTNVRNHSFYAHGFQFPDKGEYHSKYRALMERLLQRWCEIEDVDRDVMEDGCRFFHPSEFATGV
ncbi:TIGR02710 family CRISPR-associated protein [Heliobacterium undosum]|uniref:TIGR02710 family CRISPR-associated protein n=1 Tax=Heliomicrobium undosum TaxID=121734 RepID=A0A845L260_9FIRM|nr:TIGR02710 family CRISPR-associated CARF protein [Heliomicrobium undosum]MZP30627.1 TIGR02710 family CRISPR-associated protein [Heliomicrobium undosum]